MTTIQKVENSIKELEKWKVNRDKASARPLDRAISLLIKYQELIRLVRAYDKYVIEVVDREDGSIPVCLEEYFDNEWQEK